MRNHDLLTDSRKARFRVACNHFKHLVLGDSHVPNHPQTRALLHKLSEVGCEFSDSTWKSWFAKEPPMPQPSKIESLDQYLMALKQSGHQSEAEGRYLEYAVDGYFNDFIQGGLLAHLLEPTSASNPADIMKRRAQQYRPKSPLHLHFDAMDAASWHEDVLGVSWSVVATIAAERVQEMLWERWSPRTGSIFSTLKSNLHFQSESLDKDNLLQFKQAQDLLHPGLMDRLIKLSPQPDWQKVGVSPDLPFEHIHKLLFGVAADPDFLVADRLKVWTLDLVSSALAMHARAWPERYKTMALGHPPEMHYWAACYSIFFEPDELEVDELSIDYVMATWPAEWSEFSLQALFKARDIYWAELEDLGLKPMDVCGGLIKTRERHPLIYT